MNAREFKKTSAFIINEMIDMEKIFPIEETEEEHEYENFFEDFLNNFGGDFGNVDKSSSSGYVDAEGCYMDDDGGHTDESCSSGCESQDPCIWKQTYARTMQWR